MARKNYSEEFRRQAVDLYESTPGATVRGIAEDLGIVRGTLRHWLEVYGTGKKTAALDVVTVYAASHYVTPRPTLNQAVTGINAVVVGILAATWYHPVLTSAIGQRVVFADAAQSGRLAGEIDRQSPAAREVAALTDEIARLGIGRVGQ